jgi:TolA-binding protein
MEKMQGLETLEAEVTRLTLMAGNLEETLAAMEQRLADNSGQVDRMTATIEVVEPQKVEALETRLAEAERQIAVLQANAAALEASGSNHGATQPGRKTVGAFATQLLAKHGVDQPADRAAHRGQEPVAARGPAGLAVRFQGRAVR